VVLRDGKALIGASVSTTGGRYGTIADVVFDGTGTVQYALVERQGQFHPVPFSLMQAGPTGDVSLNVSSATLDTVTVDRNNLQSLFDRSFATQLRAAFGPNVARSFTTPSAASSGFSTTGTSTTTANANSTAAQRNQVYSLAGLLGGTVNAQNGEAGTISTVAISPNGQIVYAVGTNGTGDTRFAVPFALSTLNNTANGLSVNATTQNLTSVTVPTGSLPTFTNQSFATSFQSAFGDRAFGVAGRIQGLSKQESDMVRRNDTSNSDPVARAGDASRGGADAVASAGDSRRGGADAVSRAGDRTTAGGTATVAMQNSNGTTSGTTGTSTAGTTGTTTGGIINLAQDVPATQSTASANSGLLQMRDLLNFKIQAQDGAFGRVSDIVFDRNGNVQYLLGSYQGQTFPLPFTPSAFSANGNTLSFDVPISSLQQLAINPQSLPSLNNQAFTQRMQQVFGQSFGTTNTSGYTPSATAQTSTGTGTTGTTGAGTTIGTGTNGSTATAGNINRSGSGSTGTTSGTGTGTTGTKSGTGTAGGTGTSQDTWAWPTSANGRVPAAPPGVQEINQQPFSKRMNGTGTGTRTGTGGANRRVPAAPPGVQEINQQPFSKGAAGSGTRSKSGNTNNSGVGTGGRQQNPPPNGNANGVNGSGTTGSGTTGGTSGSGSTGGTSGSGTSGTGGSGGSSGGSGS